jgi:chromosome segregation ATPase
LQEKLERTETKYSALQLEMESAQVRYHEEIKISKLQVKGLQDTLQALQSEHLSLGSEKVLIQEMLNTTENDLAMTQVKVSELYGDLDSLKQRFKEEATASMSRITDLENTLQVLREDHQSVLQEKDSIRTAMDMQERDLDALELNLLGQVKDVQLDFAQHCVKLESIITDANSRNDLLTDEVTKLRSAFKLVDQANQSHQERLASAEIEAKKSAGLLAETTKKLRKTIQEKDALEKRLRSVPELHVTDDSIEASHPQLE